LRGRLSCGGKLVSIDAQNLLNAYSPATQKLNHFLIEWLCCIDAFVFFV
jgi:hypothetical protein